MDNLGDHFNFSHSLVTGEGTVVLPTTVPIREKGAAKNNLLGILLLLQSTLMWFITVSINFVVVYYCSDPFSHQVLPANVPIREEGGGGQLYNIREDDMFGNTNSSMEIERDDMFGNTNSSMEIERMMKIFIIEDGTIVAGFACQCAYKRRRYGEKQSADREAGGGGQLYKIREDDMFRNTNSSMEIERMMKIFIIEDVAGGGKLYNIREDDMFGNTKSSMEIERMMKIFIIEDGFASHCAYKKRRCWEKQSVDWEVGGGGQLYNIREDDMFGNTNSSMEIERMMKIFIIEYGFACHCAYKRRRYGDKQFVDWECEMGATKKSS
nr:hypothetical protein [Tanacetum cinerariifolium]